LVSNCKDFVKKILLPFQNVGCRLFWLF
jgi:hypothetical protein